MCDIINQAYVWGAEIMAKADALTLIEFQQKFHNEKACELYLFKKRWPEGFHCPNCNCIHYYFINTRKLYECRQCGHQVSLTAGTIMHKSKLSLLTWFWAIYLVANDKRGRSALSIAELLKLNYRTAWRLLHKIRHAMSKRDENYPLSGLIEMDDAYFGGPKQGTDGRGTHKTKVLVALETDDFGNPLYAKINVMDTVLSLEIQRIAAKCVSTGSSILSDGLSSYRKLKDLGYHHISKDYYRADADFLKWVHIIISNAKALITGTYHGLDSNYLQAYLDEFCYRFNRRFYPNKLFGHLLNACISTNHFIVA
jgi:transposase-like protein